ncbi:hypothetical protein [Prochlorococcus marinus]|uniref:hypothetical protein n=1 Tax=Prochlorococcus TaxID=1218 RepID=UPI0007BB8FE5|nr:hypothetical protein [Prochlorococcus marinus]KZR78422.1 hypothetical protein PMIT1323_00239 [Prochlorococcus marinus str. MIT 1323]
MTNQADKDKRMNDRILVLLKRKKGGSRSLAWTVGVIALFITLSSWEMGGDGVRGMLLFMLGIAFAFFINDMEKYRDEIDKMNGVYYKKERNRWKEMYDEAKKLYGED